MKAVGLLNVNSTVPCSLISILCGVFQLQKRANDELKTAHRHGVGLSEVAARLLGGRVWQRALPIKHGNQLFDGRSASVRRPPLNAAVRRGSTLPWKADGIGSDEEEGAHVVALHGSAGRLSPIEECRGMSTSAWLYFPHIELGFLFFAFEGSVASQVSGIRNAECGWVLYTALAILVSTAMDHENIDRLVLPQRCLQIDPFDVRTPEFMCSTSSAEGHKPQAIAPN